MSPSKNIVVDSIHGDIHLTELERKVIDTATFQRLRNVKQLAMGHFTYPNATHTRFAHSLGVLNIMKRVLAVTGNNGLELGENQKEDLCLAALLHDIGHYPYSHLMEHVDSVKLTEELVDGAVKKKFDARPNAAYPDHEELGKHIVTQQNDILDILGEKRAIDVAETFTRTKADALQSSKLIHSSLDMDRLDYLMRDSQATGVPFGRIDINYLLNSLRMSPKGMVGVDIKALIAAEQFLMARYFMHRSVYYHKTTVAIEETCRQLLRRLRDRGRNEVGEHYGLPLDGNAVRGIAESEMLRSFDDSFIDRIVRCAASDEDKVINGLATSIVQRVPPKLLLEVPVLYDADQEKHQGVYFEHACKQNLTQLAEKHGIPLELFLFHSTLPLRLEKRSRKMAEEESKRQPDSEDQKELIKIFDHGAAEPKDMVDIDHSVISELSGKVFKFFRLYVVRGDHLSGRDIQKLQKNLQIEVRGWLPV